MAIPPSPGKYTLDELQHDFDVAKAAFAAAEAKLTEAKVTGLAEPKVTAGRGGIFPTTQPPGDNKSDFDRAAAAKAALLNAIKK